MSEQFNPNSDRVVHVLWTGKALCPLQGVPSEWPENHKWVPLLDPKLDEVVNCQPCLAAVKAARDQ
jgi:hypothetical protein